MLQETPTVGVVQTNPARGHRERSHKMLVFCRFSELMKIRVRTPENFVSQLVKKSYSAGSWRVQLGESISYQAFKGRGP